MAGGRALAVAHAAGPSQPCGAAGVAGAGTHLLRPIANPPEEPPLRVGSGDRQRLVLLVERRDALVALHVALADWELDVRRRRAHLIVQLGVAVLHLRLLWLRKVVLHHVEEAVVLLVGDAGIAQDDDASLEERGREGLARLARFLAQLAAARHERREVHDRWLRRHWTVLIASARRSRFVARPRRKWHRSGLMAA
eukprot:2806240-Prymnesium_polylepis.1